eukprot:GEMP01004808.1.p1 GENE.GEMP01004808.1~~GEMP01004808.1.p1  ORF type:complete len:896 (+),score=234.90 GEMP01004808.1:97-2784(+)
MVLLNTTLSQFMQNGKTIRVVGVALAVSLIGALPTLIPIFKRRGRLALYFIAADIHAWKSGDSIWNLWARWRNMRHLLWIENSHQLNIEAVGAEVARNNPNVMFAHGVLAHVSTQAGIAAQQDRQAKAKLAASVPHVKHLVLIGGGHAHAHILRMSGMDPIAGLRVTLITRDVLTPYSGMIPGHVAGRYTREECHLDLLQLSEFAKIRVIVDLAINIDLDKKQVILKSGRDPISYDYLAIDVGVTPQVFGQSGFALESRTDITTVKPIDRLTYRLDQAFSKVPSWTRPHTICVVGAGVGGVELSMVLHHRYHLLLKAANKPTDWVRVVIIGRGDRLVPAHCVAVARELRKRLDERGIEVHLSDGVKEVKNNSIFLYDGTTIAYDELFWNTDGVAHKWLRECGLEVDANGFIITETTLRSVSHPEVFATGDCGTIKDYPRPKSGVFAVFAGLTLWHNLNHLAKDEPMEHYIPQTEFLGLINMGDGQGIASRGPLCVPASEWLFELKDWIDRKWMYNYRKEGLPVMESDVIVPGMVKGNQEALDMLQASTMRCGGCGSKVGSTVLSAALARLEHRGEEHNALKYSVGEDCAVVERVPGQEVTVSSVDFFKAGYLKRDLVLLGRIAAQHALSDIWAMGAMPLHGLAMCTVPLATDKLMEDDITEMLTGATKAFKENGCQLSGGHTTEGELSLGFSVEGTAPNVKALWIKGGMKKGDVLLLTKPIGTGVMQAAIMRYRASGFDVEAVLESMAMSNRAAAEAIHKACPLGNIGVTDVTGFGLLGHLAEMCKDSDVRVEVNVFQVPLFNGVVDLINEGIFSTLQPSNFRVRHAVDTSTSDVEVMQSPQYAALFDPQTSGGLLVSMPAEAAKTLKKLCPTAAEIGRVIDGAWNSSGGIVIRR